jgi:hypothetical protein
MSHYASIVQKQAMELVQAGFSARFKTYRSTPMLQIQPGDLPVLAVHILREQRRPNEQANQAEPKFHHLLTLGFSGAVHVETDKQDQLNALEEMMSELDDMLLSDPRFINLTEGVEAMDRVSQYTKVGETTLYEIRVEMQVAYSGYWPPNIVDDFKTIHITTQFPDKAHADSGTPQLEREYDIEVSTSVLQHLRDLFNRLRTRA